MESIVVFLGLKVFHSDNLFTFFRSRNAHVTFVENIIKNTFFKNKNIDILNVLNYRHRFEGYYCESVIGILEDNLKLRLQSL